MPSDEGVCSRLLFQHINSEKFQFKFCPFHRQASCLKFRALSRQCQAGAGRTSSPRENHIPRKFGRGGAWLPSCLPAFLPSFLGNFRVLFPAVFRLFAYTCRRRAYAACKIAQIIIKNQKADVEQAQECAKINWQKKNKTKKKILKDPGRKERPSQCHGPDEYNEENSQIEITYNIFFCLAYLSLGLFEFLNLFAPFPGTWKLLATIYFDHVHGNYH